MIYPPLSLPLVAFLTGLFLTALAGLCLYRPDSVKPWLRNLPRSRPAGLVLLSVAALWAFILIRTMDLGEFSSYRLIFSILIPVAFFLTINYVEEFLAVRALGMILLLLAEPLLEAAFLEPQISRLLLVVVAYAAIVKGMFFVGMPYLLRDGIDFWTRTGRRWRAGAWAGIAYGVILMAASLILLR